MKPKTVSLIISLIILSVFSIDVSVLKACGDPPSAPPADTGAGAGANASGPDTTPRSTGGQPGVDPVLLRTGEFLFQRTDSVKPVFSDDEDFQIVRTYRSRPLAILQHCISGGAIGGIEGEYYSDPCYFSWKEPVNDNPYYHFNVQFTISPSTGFIEVPAEIYNFSAVGLWPWTARAFRFQLGTGITYHVSIVYTRTDPTWVYQGYWCNVAPYTVNEIYRWESQITIPECGEPEYTNIPTVQSCCVSGGASNQVPSPQWKPGWDMSYNMHIIEYPDRFTENGLDDRLIHLYAGDGNVHTYTPTTEVDPVYGSQAEIWKCSAGDDQIVKFKSSGWYHLRPRNHSGSCWAFSPDGYLRYINKDWLRIYNFFYNSQEFGLARDVRRLDYFTDRYGRRTELFYTDSSSIYPGNLTKIRDHAGREWRYEYYADGNLKSATDPDGFKETYTYTDSGFLDQVKDHDGNIWLDNDYDTEGRVEDQLVGGHWYHIDYTSNGAAVTDPNGWSTTHVLNDDGYALSTAQETETGIVTTQYLRDSKNRVTKVTFPEQNGYDLTYNAQGDIETVSQFSNDPQDPSLTYVLTYTDDIWKLLKTVTNPCNETITYIYDFDDPNYGPDRGLLRKIRYPQVLTNQGSAFPEITFSYDSFHRLSTLTSPDGTVLKYEYCSNSAEPNSLGLVKKVLLDYGSSPCLNLTYNITYDSTGRVADVNDPSGSITTLTFNMLNLLKQVEDSAGNISKFGYNADKQLTKVERSFNGGWQTFDYGYNILTKLQTITDSLGNTTTLDYDDRFDVKQVTDANQNSTKKKYNFRQLVKEVIDAENGSTTFDYDDNGRLQIVTDAEDAQTVYEYDGYGRLEFVRYANQSYEQYSYDENGNIASFRNRAGEVITFGYDALNRLTSKTRPNESAIVLTYDIAGRVVDVSQDMLQMTFDYDRLGRLENTVDQNGYQVGYRHDLMGRRERLVYPDETFIQYEYDNAGRLEYIKDQNGYPIVQYMYDSLSRTTDVLYYRGGSFVGSMQYDYEDKVPGSNDDLGNRIERIDYCCNPSHSISYTYDNVGNVQTMDVGGGYDWSYGYDKTYQVTWADQGSATNRMVDWQYDSVYNRTYWSDTALGSLTYSDNAMNQYTGINGTTPAYDSRGNLRSYHGSYYMAYDCENRLVMAGLIAYGYDLLGRRNCRTYAPYSEQTYVWDGAHIIAEYTNGSLTKKYIYGPGIDNPVAMINVDAYGNETWYYYYADAQGSVRLILNAAGEIVEGYAYDPFGRPRVMVSEGPDGNWLTEDVQTYNSSSIGNPYMFTGRRWDHMTGIYYYRFRDNDPKLGRFLQPDPAGYIDTMNLYAYCSNNPVNWIDPWGLCKTETAGAGVAVAVVASGVALSPEAVAAAAATSQVVLVGAAVVGSAAAGYVAGDFINEQTGIGDAIGNAVGTALIPVMQWAADKAYEDDQREHRKKHPSSANDHERGQARKHRDKGGEKGDKRRPYRPR